MAGGNGLKDSTNKTRYLILGLLSEQPLSGYQIKKIVDMRNSKFILKLQY